jgi:hypothetical protein
MEIGRDFGTLTNGVFSVQILEETQVWRLYLRDCGSLFDKSLAFVADFGYTMMIESSTNDD